MARARPEQCVFKDRGRRCTRNGTGDPPLCRAHAIVFAEAARGAATGPRSALDRVLEAIMSGKRIRREDLDRATIDLLNGMFSQGPGPASGPFKPPPGFRAPPGWGPRAAPPPPNQDELERKRARATLGFGMEPLTAAMIKDRRRELAKANHPDLGGSVQRMKDINAAADMLLEAASVRSPP